MKPKLDQPAVSAVGLLVAEELDADALPVTALQLSVRADRAVGVEVGVGDPGLGQPLAVPRGLHLGGPVAHLAVQVEQKPGGAADGRQGVAA